MVAPSACPVARIDGRAVATTRRAGSAPGFPDVVCDAAIPAGARSVVVGTRRLPVPARAPRRILVIGDTGCRLEGLNAQSCDDPRAWPFPGIARAAAATRPDLIVDVGDYYYRQSPCPPLVARCAGSPYGDVAAAWYADWLVPAAPLFAAAPLVVARGNHESCGRGGRGWFRYLDPHPYVACARFTAPYAVDVGGLRIVVGDSALASDFGVVGVHQPRYRDDFAAIRRLASGAREAWFLTHRPPYLNRDQRAALDGALAPYALVLAGHFHFFAAFNVRGEPPLVINGEGGDKLDPDYVPFLGLATGGLRVEGKVFGSDRFGFALYDRAGAGWTISLRDPDGAERARCEVAGRAVRCAERRSR